MTFMPFATPYILWLAFVGLSIAPGEPAPVLPFFTRGSRSHYTFSRLLHFTLQLAQKYEKGLAGNQLSPCFYWRTARDSNSRPSDP